MTTRRHIVTCLLTVAIVLLALDVALRASEVAAAQTQPKERETFQERLAKIEAGLYENGVRATDLEITRDGRDFVLWKLWSDGTILVERERSDRPAAPPR